MHILRLRSLATFAVVATFASLLALAPAALGSTLQLPTLDNRDWEAPIIDGSGGGAFWLDGVLDDDPLGLVPKMPFVQRYSLDTDNWEVWLCGPTGYTMPQAIAALEAASVDHYAALSGGLYTPNFYPGGEEPADPDCLPGLRDGSYPLAGTPEGVLIVDTITPAGVASPGLACGDAGTDCPGILTTFPDNGRYAKIAAGDLVVRPATTVHELGHTLQWPHSWSGLTDYEYDNPIDVMSGNASVLGTPSYVELDPYSTLAFNRYQSGWVADSDVIVATGGSQTMTLQPFNVAGTQMFVVKTSVDGQFYVFGARKSSTYDPIPPAWEGVEVYFVDHLCDAGFIGGICPGIWREQHQEPPNQYQLEHVLTPGDSIDIEGLTIVVTGATATGFTLFSGPEPPSEPEAPAAPDVLAGDAEAQVDWAAPGSGGSPVLGYDLQVENLTTPGNTVTDVGLTLTETVTGLVNGDNYRARVRARNAVGDGPWSSWSAIFTPLTTPGPPGTPTISGGDGEIDAVWTAPGDDGGSAITHYEAQLENVTAGTSSIVDVGLSLATTQTGLTNGDSHRLRARAVNSAGTGSWSAWSAEAIPATIPAAPLVPEVTVTSDTTATASWTPPNSDGGAALSGYEIDLENRTTAALASVDAGFVVSYPLTALTAGDTYRFRVRAANANGWGPWSVWSPDFIPGTVASAPGVPQLTAGDAEIHAVWEAASGIGSAVDDYELELSSAQTFSLTVGPTLNHTFSGLVNDVGYQVRARAHNNSGWGPWSAWSDLATPVAPPVPPDTFIDDDNSVFEEDIEWLAAAGITAGCNPPINNMFCPNKSVTRGQMAAFLTRALGLPATSGADSFVDDNSSVFEDDIERLAAAGITAGCNPPANDRFCPNKSVTRGQMAAFLVRALQLPAAPDGFDFVDDDGSVFEDDIERLAAAGITAGCNPPANDRFCPNKSVTRGQMAAFLRRALS